MQRRFAFSSWAGALVMCLALPARATLPSVEAVTHFTGNLPGGGNGAYPQVPLLAAGGYLYGSTAWGGGSAFEPASASSSNTGGAGAVFYRFKDDGSGFEVLEAGASAVVPTHRHWLRGSDGYLYSPLQAPGQLMRYLPGGTAGWSAFGDGTSQVNGLAEIGGTLYLSYSQILATDLVGSTASTLWSGASTPNGRFPYYMIAGGNGKLYGLTSQGGNANAGVLFRFDPADASYTVLHAFTAATTGSVRTLGTRRLVEVGDKLYGTGITGPNGGGVLYRVGKDGDGSDFELVYAFTSDNTKLGGRTPENLVLGKDGHIYGTTQTGGATLTGEAANGAIFRYRIDDDLMELLYAFEVPTGAPRNNTYPNASGATVASTINVGSNATGSQPVGLVQADNGVFYGVAQLGGSYGWGTVFRFDPGDEVAEGSALKALAPTIAFTIGNLDGGIASSTVALGQRTLFSWQSRYTAACTGTSTEPDSTWIGSQPREATGINALRYAPTQVGTWTYTLTCTPQGRDYEAVSASVTLEVVPTYAETQAVGNREGGGGMGAALLALLPLSACGGWWRRTRRFARGGAR